MKKRKKAIVCALLFIAVMFTGNAEAMVLPLPEVAQPADSGWCWAACSVSVLHYYGIDVEQCTLAQEKAAVDPIWQVLYMSQGITCCTPNARIYYGQYCNTGNNLFGASGNVNDLLSRRNILSESANYPFSSAQLQGLLNMGKPVIAGWERINDPSGSPGHALLIRGLEMNQNNIPMVFYMDPNTANTGGNNYCIRELSWFTNDPSPVGGHIWRETLAVTNTHSIVPPYIQIYVNGIAGPYTARYGEFLNITAYMNPNSYTDNADHWVGLTIGGTLYYRDSAGNWTTVQTPAYQGKLMIRNYPIYSGTPPPGDYTVYFAVDLNKDGVLNNPIRYAQTVVTVQP